MSTAALLQEPALQVLRCRPTHLRRLHLTLQQLQALRQRPWEAFFGSPATPHDIPTTDCRDLRISASARARRSPSALMLQLEWNCAPTRCARAPVALSHQQAGASKFFSFAGRFCVVPLSLSAIDKMSLSSSCLVAPSAKAARARPLFRRARMLWGRVRLTKVTTPPRPLSTNFVL